MAAYNENKETVESRSLFIDTLSEISTVMTGYGIYAHIGYDSIEKLFAEFKHQDLPARTFAKRYLRTIH